MKKICYLVILLFTTACSGIKTYVDYDEKTDFEQYTSYSFYKDIDSGLDSLDQKRFMTALKGVMKENNFRFTPEDPDFKINFYSAAYKEDNAQNIGISIGTIGSRVGGNVASGIPIGGQRRFLSITVEFVNAESDILFWQGVAEGKFQRGLPPKKRRVFFQKTLQKLLQNYPPEL